MIRISPKAFFFDFDGVICDSERAHMVAALKVLQNYQIDFSEEEYFQRLLGFDDKDLFQFLFDEHGKALDQDTLTALIKNKNNIFMEEIRTKLVLFDGVLDFIKRLTEKRIPLAVVSGALSIEVKQGLKQLKLEDYFLFTVCTDQVKNSKPHPESYEAAYFKMLDQVPSLRPENCWALEDSPHGIESAKKAGLKVIGITHSLPQTDLVRADCIVQHYQEIMVV